MNKKDIQTIVNRLRAGEVVAIPTETVYGLAVDAFNLEAIHRLYQIKNRPYKKPTSIAIKDSKDLVDWTEYLNQDMLKLIEHFWPGPLSLILPYKSKNQTMNSLGKGTIGIRCSSNQIVREIINMLGNAICLTSANLSGEKDAITAEHVNYIFGNKIFVLENDLNISGIPSTIVDLTVNPYVLVREGSISMKELDFFLPGLIFNI